MQQEMFHQQNQTIKADPRIRMFSLLAILYGIICAMTWFFAITNFIIDFGVIGTSGQFTIGSFSHYFMQPLLWSFLFILYLFIIRVWKRLDQKRQAAVQGDQKLVADAQPFPNAQALALPLTIRMRISRKWMIIIFTSTVFAFLIPFLAGLFFGSSANSSPLSLSVILISLGVGLLIAILFVGSMLLAMYVKGREQITLTESGILLVGVTPKTHSIAWSEAKLFAIINPYPQPRWLKNQQPLTFELANEHETVRWTSLPKTSIPWSFVQPVLPPEEYEQQMQNVLSVVAAKTGLSLYDLRKKL